MSLVLFFCQNPQRKRKKEKMHKRKKKKLTTKKLNVARQFLKHLIRIFDATLCNLTAGAGQYQFLEKNYHPIHLFSLTAHSHSNEGFYIYFTHPSLPTPPPFINHTISWKSKLKHMGVDITYFFQDAKSSLTKHKKCLLETSYGPSETSRLELFTKKH